MTDLDDARAELQSKLDEGTICPCCRQFARRYRRKMNSGMAVALCWIVREFREKPRWIDMATEAPRRVLESGGQYGALVHWNLIEPAPRTANSGRPVSRSSGPFQPTAAGVAFATARISVPRYVLLYNNKAEDFSDEMTTIADALGDHFDYYELMGYHPDDSISDDATAGYLF